MARTRNRKATIAADSAQTKKMKGKAIMDDMQADLPAEYPEKEERSTQNDQTSSSNLDNETSSRASSLSPPPTVMEEPEWVTKQSSYKGQEKQQDGNVEDTIVVDAAVTTDRQCPNQVYEQPQLEDQAKDETDTVVPKLDAEDRKALWKSFECPTSQQIEDYLKAGNKIPGYLVLQPEPCTEPVDFRVKTPIEVAAEAAKEAEQKHREELVSNPKMFDQNGPHWPYRKIWIRPATRPYERVPFWVEAKDIPEYIEYCKHQRMIWEKRLKIDQENGAYGGSGIFYAEFDRRERKWEWCLLQEFRPKNEGKYGLGA